MPNPKVFISYSHDSPDHADRVLTLSNRLRSDGIDCMIDQYNPAPPSEWPFWMEEQIQNADFVLMVGTETYHKRVHKKEEPDKGFGVCWEANLIYNLLYQAKLENTKFIPVIFDKKDQQYIPLPLQDSTCYLLIDEYDNLYRYLTNLIPEKPGLGKPKQLPPLERRTDFYASPFMAPLLPERFVERPRLFNKILTYLLKKDRRIPVAVTQHLNMLYEQKGVLAFNAKNPIERNQAVAKTIAVSLDLLDAFERQHYMDLAIFPEDTEVPFATISQLWGLSLDETEQLLQSFNNLALLKLHLGNKTIRLHDELHFYLNAQPMDFVAVHQKLIASWGNLEHLPDEYAWRYLAYHLINSKQPAKLQQLLCDPLWLHLKLANTDIYGLIADFDYFQADQDLSYIQRALQLSTHVLYESSVTASRLYREMPGL